MALPVCLFRINKHISSLFKLNNTISINQARGKRWKVPVLKELKRRQKKAGPDPLRHRSVWNNWNYNAELFAFSKRLQEEFNDATLRRAFTHSSYIEQEDAKRKELGIITQDVHLNLEDNSQLIDLGTEIMRKYITAYLKNAYPLFPSEGISSLLDYLMSDDLISIVASKIGIPDLILCSDFPPEQITLAKCFKALVGAIDNDQGRYKAEMFVQDFIITQLVGKDVNEIWEIPSPVAMLQNILKSKGISLPEPRLIRETGRNTLFAVYVVGLYIDKVLFSEGAGESVTIAEEMAARDGLRRIFQTTDNQKTLPFGTKGRNLKLNSEKTEQSALESIRLS